jgi:TPR repeat protein
MTDNRRGKTMNRDTEYIRNLPVVSVSFPEMAAKKADEVAWDVRRACPWASVETFFDENACVLVLIICATTFSDKSCAAAVKDAMQRLIPILPVAVDEYDKRAASAALGGMAVLDRKSSRYEAALQEFFASAVVNEKLVRAVVAAQTRQNSASATIADLYLMGLGALEGIGGPRDCKRGCDMIMASTLAGLLDAKKQLAFMYRFGKGVPRDARSAAKWTTEALSQAQRAFDAAPSHQSAMELAGVYSFLASTQEEAGQIEQARQCYEKLCDLWKERDAGLLAAASAQIARLCHIDGKQVRQSIARAVEDALAFEKQGGSAQNRQTLETMCRDIVALYEADDDLESAQPYAQHLDELNPQQENLYQLRVRFLKKDTACGDEALERGDKQAAQQFYLRAVDICDAVLEMGRQVEFDDMTAYFKCGFLAERAGDMHRAYALYRHYSDVYDALYRKREEERLAAEEAARLEAERLAAEEAARLEAERLAAEERARLEAARLEAEEQERLQTENPVAQEEETPIVQEAAPQDDAAQSVGFDAARQTVLEFAEDQQQEQISVTEDAVQTEQDDIDILLDDTWTDEPQNDADLPADVQMDADEKPSDAVQEPARKHGFARMFSGLKRNFAAIIAREDVQNAENDVDAALSAEDMDPYSYDVADEQETDVQDVQDAQNVQVHIHADDSESVYQQIPHTDADMDADTDADAAPEAEDPMPSYSQPEQQDMGTQAYSQQPQQADEKNQAPSAQALLTASKTASNYAKMAAALEAGENLERAMGWCVEALKIRRDVYRASGSGVARAALGESVLMLARLNEKNGNQTEAAANYEDVVKLLAPLAANNEILSDAVADSYQGYGRCSANADAMRAAIRLWEELDAQRTDGAYREKIAQAQSALAQLQ